MISTTKRKNLIVDYRKSVLTILLFALFIFFAVYGPLERAGHLTHIATLENEFFSPKLVTDIKVNPIKAAGMISQGGSYVLGEFGMVRPFQASTVKEAGLISFHDEMGASLHNEKWSAEILHRLQKQYGEDTQIAIKMQEELCYAEIYEQGKLQYLYFENISHNTVQGFSGPIYLGMKISLNGQLQKVSYINSKETESYLRKVLNSTYLSQYQGLSLKDNQHEIDAISGATITTRAMAESVTEAFQTTAPIVFATYYDFDLESFAVNAFLTYWWIIHIIIIAGIFLYAFLPIKKTKRSRLLFSLFTLAYTGFGLNSSFTYITFLLPFLGTEVSLFLGLYALFTLLGAIWGKNIYCSYVCPFGAAQMISLKYSPFKKKKLFITNKQAEYVRYAMTIILVGGFVMGYKTFGNYELFPDLFSTQLSSYWFYIAIAFVAISIRFPMLWCRVACPTGCVLDGLKDLSNAKSKLPVLNKKLVLN